MPFELTNREREKRTVAITLRLTDSEAKMIDAIAATEGLTVPNMIRRLLLARVNAKRKRG